MDSMTRTRRRVRVIDVLYVAFFVYYLGGALIVLGHGVGAFWASRSPSLHTSLHFDELGSGAWARAAERMADGAHSAGSWPQFALDYGFSLFALIVAGFLLWLRPRDRTARLLAIATVGSAGAFNLLAQRTWEIIPLTSIESFLQSSAHIIAGLAYAYALLLFPDGKPVPRWPLPAIVALYAPATAGAVFLTLRVEGSARPAALLVFHGIVAPLLGVAAQAYRFRRSSSAAEHQQARLLFWALLPALGFGVGFVVLQGFGSITASVFAGRHVTEQPTVVFRAFQPVFALIPLALLAGIARYRLWDIDRVVNRTLVYGLVTAALGGAYFGIVVLLQPIFNPLDSDLAVAASTLAVAAAFRPVRDRIQRFVDRRFYRRRYDAQKTVEAFGHRLRDEVDLDSLAAELRNVVSDSMQPSNASLLLRAPQGNLEWQWTHHRSRRPLEGP